MRPLTTARKLSEDLKVDVKTYSIIYELINDIKLALEGLLDPEFEENISEEQKLKTLSLFLRLERLLALWSLMERLWKDVIFAFLEMEKFYLMEKCHL